MNSVHSLQFVNLLNLKILPIILIDTYSYSQNKEEKQEKPQYDEDDIRIWKKIHFTHTS